MPGAGLALLTACSSGAALTQPEVDGSLDTPLDVQAEVAPERPPVTCHLEETSDLPGVTIHVTRDDCTFTLAEARAGISIPYEVRVEHDLEIVPQPPPGTYCYRPGDAGLLIGSVLGGESQRYCLCDQGPPLWSDCQKSWPVKAGIHALSFDWDGVNWNGPSDTSNPKGTPFPPGVYRLDLTAKGFVGSPDAGAPAFTVTAAFNVNLVE